MPIYEFRCASCGHRFEVMQRFADPAPACEACGGAVEKLISAPAFQFKGSGWYVTDYANKGKKGEQGDGDDGKAAKEKADGAGDSGAKESAKEGKADSAKTESGGGKSSGAKASGAKPAGAGGE